MRRALLGIIAVVALAGPAAARAPKPPDEVAAGAAMFRERCAVCHGPRGDGRGAVARSLSPRPADLTTGRLKVHETAPGAIATAADVARTLERGVPGTAMPAFTGLSRAERGQLVAYVRWLAGSPSDPEAVAIPAPPPLTDADIARGAQVFVDAGCGLCHGEDGRGDGLMHDKLRDGAGRPIRPADLARPERFRGGARPEDLFRTLTVGLDGTPMIGVGDRVPEADRWALVAWIQAQRPR